MTKDNLENKVKKAVLNIDKKVAEIYNSLSDLSLKLCHIIRSSRLYDDFYSSMRDSKEYYK